MQQGKNSGIDVIAVTGVCGPERRNYALRLAKERGFIFVPAQQTCQGFEAVDRMIDLIRGAFSANGAVLEFPAEVPAIEIVGAMTSASAATRLNDLVCVLDLAHLIEDLESEVLMAEPSTEDGEIAACVSRAELLINGIEMASTVAFMNSGCLSSEEFEQTTALISHLAPNSHLFRCEHSRAVHAASGHAFTLETENPGWVALLNGDFDPQRQSSNVAAYRYEQYRPFHPERLWRALTECMSSGACGRVLRSSGFARLATRPHITARWDHVGKSVELTPLSLDHQIGAEDELLAFGQDLAFFGIGLDEEALKSEFDSAALSDAELAAGPMTWATFRDPFPEWDTVET